MTIENDLLFGLTEKVESFFENILQNQILCSLTLDILEIAFFNIAVKA